MRTSPLAPLYTGAGGAPKHNICSLSRVRCPPPQFTPLVIASWCLGEALRGSHRRHHAIVLMELSLDPLLDQELEGRHRAERVLNTKVLYVWYLDRLHDRRKFFEIACYVPQQWHPS